MSLVLCDEIQTVCLDSVLHNLCHMHLCAMLLTNARLLQSVVVLSCLSFVRGCLGADDPWDASQILYAAFMLSLLVTKLDAS